MEQTVANRETEPETDSYSQVTYTYKMQTASLDAFIHTNGKYFMN